ncbi:GyrI-like domain-containing protein [Psychroserpens sp. XS_ASV72]|uniref:GyrI-like domain-containing protein n=1 Tax=Psychroserpens sp. XS_ASV72 TaxID=3241293 RepID=UPI003517ED44
MMPFRVEVIPNRYIAGMRTKTCMVHIMKDTQDIAKQFMPRRHEVNHRIGNHVFSIQNFGPDFSPANPHSEFEKWIGIEVSEIDALPKDIKSFVIPTGTYAVFDYKGSMKDFSAFRARIFQEWLPNSDYILDDRPHFEIVDENYRKDLNNTEESVWIPVQKKI